MGVEIEKLKEMLEERAQDSLIIVKGEKATLKSPEQREAEMEIEEWKETSNKYTPIKEFRIAHELVNVLLSTNQYNGIIFLGEGGIGKTVLTINSIKCALKPDEWEYSNGYTTPLSMYTFLFNNRNKKMIILDDVEGVFNNKLSLSILKGALWDSDGKRICQYSSTSDKAKVPQKFIMKAKVIVLCNHIPKEDDSSTRAMISRTIPYRIAFNFKEKLDISKKFIMQDNVLSISQKLKIIGILESNVTEATRDFNFRTLRKLMAFIQYDDSKAEKLFIATTETDPDIEAYMEAVKHTNVVEAQLGIFREKTGKSRATFFRVKRGLKSSKVSKSHQKGI